MSENCLKNINKIWRKNSSYFILINKICKIIYKEEENTGQTNISKKYKK